MIAGIMVNLYFKDKNVPLALRGQSDVCAIHISDTYDTLVARRPYCNAWD